MQIYSKGKSIKEIKKTFLDLTVEMTTFLDYTARLFEYSISGCRNYHYYHRFVGEHKWDLVRLMEKGIAV